MINDSNKNRIRKLKNEILNDEINNMLNDSYSIPKEKEIYFNNHNLFNQNKTYRNSIHNSSNTITTTSTTIIKNDILNEKIINNKIKENKNKINHKIKKNKTPTIKEKKKVSFDTNFIEIIDVKSWKKYNKNNTIGFNGKYKDFTQVEYCKCIIF